MKDIFRQASLDKISSPEQLDRLVRLTSSRSWMGIAFFAVILTSILIWGVTGTIPKKYHGQGILISSGGTSVVQSKVSGILSDVSIEKGDYVKFGDVIARTDQEDTIDQLDNLEKDLEMVIEKNTIQYGDQIEEQGIEIEKQKGEIQKQKIVVTDSLSEVKKLKSDLMRAKDILLKKEQLLNEGAISTNEYDESKFIVQSATREHEIAVASYEQSVRNKDLLELGLLQLQNGKEALEDELINNDEVKSILKQIEQYKDKLIQSDIVSPVEGKVLRVNIKKDNIVQTGQTVATVLQKGIGVNDTTILFYLPIEQGKALKPGMKVNVYPSIYNRQEYGHMKAVVTDVSSYAVSTGEIRDTLGSEELVNKFMQRGVLVEVKANLIKDENTLSGFYWSSKRGKELEVDEGIICDVSVTVEENKPISLVIPILRAKLLP